MHLAWGRGEDHMQRPNKWGPGTSVLMPPIFKVRQAPLRFGELLYYNTCPRMRQIAGLVATNAVAVTGE